MTKKALIDKLKALYIQFNTSPREYQKRDYYLLLQILGGLIDNNPELNIVTNWEEVSDDTIPSSELTYNSLIEKANISDIPTEVSQLNNDAGYLTEETDPTVPSWAKTANKPTYTAEEVGALPSSTFIPENVSDLNNDAGYITSKDIPVVDKTSDTSSSFAIDPNKMYMFGERNNLTITFNPGESGIVNEYMFQFTSGSTATDLFVPNVVWMKELDIQPNKKYLVSIENNLGLIGEWNNE